MYISGHVYCVQDLPLVEVQVEKTNAKTLWRKMAGGGLYRHSIGPSRTWGRGGSEFQLPLSTHFNKGASRTNGQSGIPNNSTMSSG